LTRRRHMRTIMTKHHGRRVARPLATGVMGPTITTTRRIPIPMKIGPSTPFPGFASAIDVGEKSPLEKYRPNVTIETTPDERRVLHAAHVASIALRRTFDHWVTVGRGLQMLRQKADQIGTRNAFNDLRDQHRLGDKHFRKEVVSRLLKVMDNLEAVEAWRATLTEKQRVEWASPDTIVRRCPVFNKPKPATAEAKPSPYAKLQQANAELQIELHDVKRRAADGDLFDLKNDGVETIAGTIIEKVGIDKAVKIARAILNSPEHDERERAEREQELAERTEELTERAQKRAQRKAGTKKPKAG
jgi:hypothetical protein